MFHSTSSRVMCQKTTPKGKVFPVPLGSMPLISTPFQRVSVDMVVQSK